ncbi:hypothetical protein H5T87_05940 [bacterium]|nr:hypothetical protein [bacterium]
MEQRSGRKSDVQIWDFGEFLHNWSIAYVSFAGVRTLGFSPEGNLLASGSDDGMVKLWSFPEGKEIFTLKHTDRVWFVSFSPKGNYLASGSEDGRAKIIDVKRLKLIAELRHNSGIWQIIFSPDEELLAFGAYQEVHIWALRKRKILDNLYHSHWVNSVSFSPDGNFLTVGLENGTIKVWRIERRIWK